MDATLKSLYDDISQSWDTDLLEQLKRYIEIPNVSPAYDTDWESHGYMKEAMILITHWCQQQPIKDMKLEVFESPGRTPLLLIDIPGQSDNTILLYGHMDKQPEMTGWDKNLGPWKPVIKDGKLYGRGGADDGYAVFSALTAIATLQKHNIPHAHCVVLIEASEESGSTDLPYYLEKINSRFNNPNFVICLDSMCGNYQQMWSTTSLRGLIDGTLTIEVLETGLHSGIGSGAVPSTFCILRELLNRIEQAEDGKILLKELQVDIPEHRIAQTKTAANTLGNELYALFPFAGNTQATTDNPCELILNRTWRAALSITGMDGVPSTKKAGNVTLPKLNVKLSMRTPPTCDVEKASTALKTLLEENPPHNATINFHIHNTAPGWHAPEVSDWLKEANDNASQLYFNRPTAYLGEGGSIPFMGMLGEQYPNAEFLITGILGPKSNAHGPNEFLHITMVKKITACIAAVLAYHHQHYK